MEVSSQFHASATLPRERNPRYSLDRRLGGPHGRSGHVGDEMNICPYRESNPGRPARILVRGGMSKVRSCAADVT
jgi:hypothetical protein